MSSKYSDTVSRMLNRVALQEGHEGANPAASNTAKPHLGPLTDQELAELTFLCNTVASGNNNNNNNDGDSFANVEGDQLVSLVELLDRHVNLAVAVNLVEQSLQHVQPGAAPSVIASEIDKVSQCRIVTHSHAFANERTHGLLFSFSNMKKAKTALFV